MLAVVGSPSFVPGASPVDAGGAGGLAAGIARAAAAAGADVQLVGKVGDDVAGDAVLLALARWGVGHMALLRDAGRATPVAPADAAVADPVDTASIGALLAGPGPGPSDATWEAGTPGVPGLALEPADITVGLLYVQDFRVLVAADPLDEPSMAAIAAAAVFADATLVVVAPRGQVMDVAPTGAIVLEAPDRDPDSAFAALVGRFAAALDRGVEAGDAFRTATLEGGWERAAG